MGIATIVTTVTGRSLELPTPLVAQYPELAAARWRRGGLMVRVAGWCLGQRSVAAITLWRTVWIARDCNLNPELLLHELRHVHQFEASATFPLRYLWETVRRGYVRNRYEVDARLFASERVRQTFASAAPNLNG